MHVFPLLCVVFWKDAEEAEETIFFYTSESPKYIISHYLPSVPTCSQDLPQLSLSLEVSPIPSPHVACFYIMPTWHGHWLSLVFPVPTTIPGTQKMFIE